MQQRHAARLGRDVSEIGFGAWQIGGSWGDVSEEDGKKALNAALDLGVTFIDTADSYGPEVSEQLIREALHPYADDLVGGPGDLEDEMLDGTAVDRRENSRLSCQIKLQDGCEYHVTTPSEQL